MTDSEQKGAFLFVTSFVYYFPLSFLVLLG